MAGRTAALVERRSLCVDHGASMSVASGGGRGIRRVRGARGVSGRNGRPVVHHAVGADPGVDRARVARSRDVGGMVDGRGRLAGLPDFARVPVCGLARRVRGCGRPAGALHARRGGNSRPRVRPLDLHFAGRHRGRGRARGCAGMIKRQGDLEPDAARELRRDLKARLRLSRTGGEILPSCSTRSSVSGNASRATKMHRWGGRRTQ